MTWTIERKWPQTIFWCDDHFTQRENSGRVDKVTSATRCIELASNYMYIILFKSFGSMLRFSLQDIDNVDIAKIEREAAKKKRRSSKRVSFSASKTVKEFGVRVNPRIISTVIFTCGEADMSSRGKLSQFF